MQCAAGNFFDETTGYCLPDSECHHSTTSGPLPSTTRHPTQPPTTSVRPVVHCDHEGLLPDPSNPRDCHKYYACTSDGSGGWLITTCECKNGLVFDPDMEVCTWSYQDCMASQPRAFFNQILMISSKLPGQPEECNA